MMCAGGMTPADEPLFSSAHAALTFALNFCGQNYDRPLMNRMAARSEGAARDLSDWTARRRRA
ncbi:MAG: hypothetical protein LBJ59_02420 [Zoogloeaceae bacterium]|jgi:hypothetical protein|nr:hypothetical protein [Zoogloeaceae bacterium]